MTKNQQLERAAWNLWMCAHDIDALIREGAAVDPTTLADLESAQSILSRVLERQKEAA